MGKRPWKACVRALNSVACGLLLALPQAADASEPANGRFADHWVPREIARWNRQIEEASARFAIPADWIRIVMRSESGGRTELHGRPITSSAGAMGLMQLMPGTWAEMRRLHGLGSDPNDPHDNILAGSAYLRAMYDRFGYPGLFAAYNAGPARYAEHLTSGRPLPSETVAYVAAAGLNESARAAALRKQTSSCGIFISLTGSRQRDTGDSPAAAPSAALFVRLGTASARSE